MVVYEDLYSRSLRFRKVNSTRVSEYVFRSLTDIKCDIPLHYSQINQWLNIYIDTLKTQNLIRACIRSMMNPLLPPDLS